MLSKYSPVVIKTSRKSFGRPGGNVGRKGLSSRGGNSSHYRTVVRVKLITYL